MSDYSRLKEVVEEIALGVVERSVRMRKVHATLVQVDPFVKFRLTEKVYIYGSALISPKDRVFVEAEIGKKFLFLEDLGGQQYIYLYEPADPGANGTSST